MTSETSSHTAGCSCVAEINAKLAEHNAEIVCTIFGKPPRAVIETIKRDPKKRGKPPKVLASFCPFCGGDYDNAYLLGVVEAAEIMTTMEGSAHD